MRPRSLVLRPEPGATHTVERLAAAGFDAVRLPLFTVVPVDWTAPDAAGYDALLLTSANAVRHAGATLSAVAHLPVVAVGARAAAVAREAGLTVAVIGDGDARAAMDLARAAGFTRLLHLTGRDHRDVGARRVVVYDSQEVAVPPRATWSALDNIVLLHSARAARRFAELADRDGLHRGRVAVAVLSEAVLAAAGMGWASTRVAATPTDAALVAAAKAQVDQSPVLADKRAMDKVPTATRASRRGLVALLALAFVAGLTLMAYAARRGGWFTPAPVTAASPLAPIVVAPAPPPASSPTVAAIDPTTLATREATLAGQLAALEARTAAVTTDAAAAGAQSARAEALLVAMAVRRQIERGQPLGYLEEQLRERFGQNQARSVAIAIGVARQPVTIGDLSAGLEAMTARLLVAPQDDWLDALRREIRTLVVLRRAGSPSPLPLDRLAHARELLAGGRVEAARTEIAALPGAPAAGAWLAAARRWTLAQQALDAIENAALTVPPPVPALSAALPGTTTTVLP